MRLGSDRPEAPRAWRRASSDAGAWERGGLGPEPRRGPPSGLPLSPTDYPAHTRNALRADSRLWANEPRIWRRFEKPLPALLPKGATRQSRGVPVRQAPSGVGNLERRTEPLPSEPYTACGATAGPAPVPHPRSPNTRPPPVSDPVEPDPAGGTPNVRPRSVTRPPLNVPRDSSTSDYGFGRSCFRRPLGKRFKDTPFFLKILRGSQAKPTLESPRSLTLKEREGNIPGYL